VDASIGGEPPHLADATLRSHNDVSMSAERRDRMRWTST
jgi:hypothetical protein